jgi:hypothetical protein
MTNNLINLDKMTNQFRFLTAQRELIAKRLS